jgi:hypothetical protein
MPQHRPIEKIDRLPQRIDGRICERPLTIVHPIYAIASDATAIAIQARIFDAAIAASPGWFAPNDCPYSAGWPA